MKVKTETPEYLANSIRRLSVMADKPLHTPDDVFVAMVTYGKALLPVQREVLMKYARGN